MSVNRTSCGTPTRLALSPRLAALRAELIAAGVTAESPLLLDAEGERLALRGTAGLPVSAADASAITALTAEVGRLAAELAAMRAAMDSLAKTEIAVKAVWQAGFSDGQAASSPETSRPARRRDRHGLRLARES